VLKANGVISTYSSGPPKARANPFTAVMRQGISVHFILVYVMPREAHHLAARDLNAALEAGRYRPHVAGIFKLDETARHTKRRKAAARSASSSSVSEAMRSDLTNKLRQSRKKRGNRQGLVDCRHERAARVRGKRVRQDQDPVSDFEVYARALRVHAARVLQTVDSGYRAGLATIAGQPAYRRSNRGLRDCSGKATGAGSASLRSPSSSCSGLVSRRFFRKRPGAMAA